MGEFAGGSNDPPEVNSIHQAMVEKVAHFGIFVKMKGFAKSGLVYSSQARRSTPCIRIHLACTLARTCRHPSRRHLTVGSCDPQVTLTVHGGSQKSISMLNGTPQPCTSTVSHVPGCQRKAVTCFHVVAEL